MRSRWWLAGAGALVGYLVGLIEGGWAVVGWAVLGAVIGVGIGSLRR
jgi:hypothetical protein